ncbi:hypothetical protein Tco_0961787, partial [Tanacetum coccineum]
GTTGSTLPGTNTHSPGSTPTSSFGNNPSNTGVLGGGMGGLGPSASSMDTDRGSGVCISWRSNVVFFQNPLFLHPSDGPGSLCVQEKLTGSQNYRSWKRAFEIGETYDIVQQGQSISDYYTRMKCVWEELDSMNELPRIANVTPEITTFLNAIYTQKEEQRLFQFLNGLDDHFSAQRIATEESQRECELVSSFCLGVDSMALYEYKVIDKKKSVGILISQIGNAKLNNGLVLKDVLLVPDFKFSLLSVSKLAEDAK